MDVVVTPIPKCPVQPGYADALGLAEMPSASDYADVPELRD